MPQIYSHDDGYALHYGSSWADARGNTPASSSSSSGSSYAVRVTAGAGRGSVIYSVSRAFMSFDVPGSVYHQPEKADLVVRGFSSTSGTLIVVGADYSSSISNDDFDNITDASTALSNTDGSGGGTFNGQVPTYSLASSWSSGWNTIPLNDTALMAMAKAGAAGEDFKIALINYTYDYLDVVLAAGLGGITSAAACGVQFSSSRSDPYLNYTAGKQAIFMGANF